MKWGILGAAAIARKNVRAMLQVPDDAELVAVGSRSLEKAQKFVKDMQAYGLCDTVKCYPSYDDVSSIIIIRFRFQVWEMCHGVETNAFDAGHKGQRCTSSVHSIAHAPPP